LFRGLDLKDGTVSIFRDPWGAPFALFHRTDIWDEVRDYSANR
jgi:hypothetical protein